MIQIRPDVRVVVCNIDVLVLLDLVDVFDLFTEILFFVFLEIHHSDYCADIVFFENLFVDDSWASDVKESHLLRAFSVQSWVLLNWVKVAKYFVQGVLILADWMLYTRHALLYPLLSFYWLRILFLLLFSHALWCLEKSRFKVLWLHFE